MASIRRLKVYAEIEDGKRVVSVLATDLPALSTWLGRNGYSYKTNRNGNICDVMISEKNAE